MSRRPDHPDHLGGAYDWLSQPHEQLFRMVHDKMNVETGMSAAADWARLGDQLTAVGDELAELARDTANAWEGTAAEPVEGCVGTLAKWAREAGGTATEVSACVTTATELAAHARDAMPPPVELSSPMPTAAAMARAFTSTGFESAPALLVDQQNDVLDRMNARHAEAARVMDQFQAASRDVYRTVPRFEPPNPAHRPQRREHEAPAEPSTRAAAAPGTPGSGGEAAGHNSPGKAVTAGPTGGTATPSGTASGVPTSPSTTMGAVPMAGATGRREPDHERRGLDFLEDPGIWECPEGDLLVSAAVIGEVPRHE
ncbi:PPE domain-containing protein [Actinophytocola sp. NPDC049390]|uniref:PPE domain-containing protein n=1 Tax=Actinophytocola sp. NPDC049390 TaxID=3363894 RepID=UPI00379DB6EF